MFFFIIGVLSLLIAVCTIVYTAKKCKHGAYPNHKKAGTAIVAIALLIGIVGMVGMLVAYPLYRKVFKQTKEKHTPRILELTAELTGEKVE